MPTLSAFNNGVPRKPNNAGWLYYAENLYPLAGGDVEAEWINDQANGGQNPTDNTCALRISIALNSSGVTIPYIWSDDDSDGIKDSNESDITVEGDNGKYYFLRAEFLVKYCLEVFPTPDIHVERQDVLNGATPTNSLREVHGLYLMVPFEGSNLGASGHCDFYYYSPSLGYYKTVSGMKWQHIGDLYFWILE